MTPKSLTLARKIVSEVEGCMPIGGFVTAEREIAAQDVADLLEAEYGVPDHWTPREVSDLIVERDRLAAEVEATPSPRAESIRKLVEETIEHDRKLLADVKAERDRLAAFLENTQKAETENTVSREQQIIGLQVEVDALRAALEKYGGHHIGCLRTKYLTNLGGEPTPCDCGFLAALATDKHPEGTIPPGAKPFVLEQALPAPGVPPTGEKDKRHSPVCLSQDGFDDCTCDGPKKKGTP